MGNCPSLPEKAQPAINCLEKGNMWIPNKKVWYEGECKPIVAETTVNSNANATVNSNTNTNANVNVELNSISETERYKNRIRDFITQFEEREQQVSEELQKQIDQNTEEILVRPIRLERNRLETALSGLRLLLNKQILSREDLILFGKIISESRGGNNGISISSTRIPLDSDLTEEQQNRLLSEINVKKQKLELTLRRLQDQLGNSDEYSQEQLQKDKRELEEDISQLEAQLYGEIPLIEGFNGDGGGGIGIWVSIVVFIIAMILFFTNRKIDKFKLKLK